jgi:predicted Fe-S protein YdhL (DUF1289 family)
MTNIRPNKRGIARAADRQLPKHLDEIVNDWDSLTNVQKTALLRRCVRTLLRVELRNQNNEEGIQ